MASISEPVTLVRSRLEERNCQIVRDRGDTFAAHCPGHPDRNPSLVVSTGEDGRALLTCHAGCDLQQVLNALYLKERDLFATRAFTPRAVTATSVCSKGRTAIGSDVSTALRSALSDSSWGQGDPEGDLALDKTRARAAVLGADLDKPFACVIPRHDHSAQLRWGGGRWHYSCTGCSDLGLAEVRAAVAYGGVRDLSPTEANRWRDKLDYEAELVEPIGILATPPEGDNAASKIARSILLYLGLRAASGGFAPDKPFTFAREFCAAWCGVTLDQARFGMRDLKRSQFLTDTGERNGRAVVWRLSAAEPTTSDSDLEDDVDDL